KAQGLVQALQAEVEAARKWPDSDGSERWQLYLLTKSRNEVSGLINAKRAELGPQQVLAASFDGGDPLLGDAGHYMVRLAKLVTRQQMALLHQNWEAAYVAAHEAKLLGEAIWRLSEQSAELVAHHAQQQQVWREREAQWERQRQYAEQREARIRYKLQADEDVRNQRLKQANTLTAPSAAVGGVLLNRAGSLVAGGATTAIEQAFIEAGKELLRDALIRTGKALGRTLTVLLYVPELGNGELTEAQRLRHLEGLGVRAELLGLDSNQDLNAIAASGGTATLGHRLKVEHLEGGSAIAMVSTDHGISSQVPVRNAIHDPLTDTYRVEGLGPTDRTLVFDAVTPPVKSGSEPVSATAGVLVLPPQVEVVGAGVDLRFDDCIVCIPGQAPQYFSFALSPPGTAVVSGKGQAAAANWWANAAGTKGAPVPAQVGDHLRGRVFTSFTVFETAVWQTIGQDLALLGQFDELNQKRLLNGYAPVARKSDWLGSRHEFALRHESATGTGAGLYDLDQLNIYKPASNAGVQPVIPTFKPWFGPSIQLAMDAAMVQGQAALTWTPVVPPGRKFLGATTLPLAPPLPGVYPGGSAEPVAPQIEILPGEHPDDTGATIPGFGGDTELPTSGLVNNEPAEPLEVGEYADLGRRSINDQMDVDHITSRMALKIYITRKYPEISIRDLTEILKMAPSIVIPAIVHRRYSETYGGRNGKTKQLEDASDLRGAVDSNIDALKPGLLEYGFSEEKIELAREGLHGLHEKKEFYE
ncbi:MAG: S-type pyocin domain-containing protein, partial [Pseudomonas sp.]